MIQKITKEYVPFGSSGQIQKNYGESSSSTIGLDEQLSSFITEWKAGFDSIISRGGVPELEEHTAVLQILSQFQYMYATYLGFWNDKQKYVIGSWVIANDNMFYRSKTGVPLTPNVGNDPITSPANWESLPSLITASLSVQDASRTVKGIAKIHDATAITSSNDTDIATPLVVKNMISDNKTTTALAVAGVDDIKHMTAKTTKEAIENGNYLKANSSGNASAEEVLYSNKFTLDDDVDSHTMRVKEFKKLAMSENLYPDSGLFGRVVNFDGVVIRDNPVKPSYITLHNGATITFDKAHSNSSTFGGTGDAVSASVQGIIEFLHTSGNADRREINDFYVMKVTAGSGTDAPHSIQGSPVYRAITLQKPSSSDYIVGAFVSVESGTVYPGSAFRYEDGVYKGNVSASITSTDNPRYIEYPMFELADSTFEIFAEVGTVFNVFYCVCRTNRTILGHNLDYVKHPVFNPADLANNINDAGDVVYFDGKYRAGLATSFAPTGLNTGTFNIDLTDIGTSMSGGNTYDNYDLTDKKSVIYKLNVDLFEYHTSNLARLGLSTGGNNLDIHPSVSQQDGIGSNSIVLEAPVTSTTDVFRYYLDGHNASAQSDAQAEVEIIGYREH